MTKPVKFTHDTTLEFRVGPLEGEDSIEIDVRLHCVGTNHPGTLDFYNRHIGTWEPGDSAEAEITLERVEISTDPGKDVFRPAVRGHFLGDDAIIDAAEAYVDDLPDGLVSSLIDVQAGGYDPDLHAEMRAEARREAKGGM